MTCITNGTFEYLFLEKLNIFGLVLKRPVQLTWDTIEMRINGKSDDGIEKYLMSGRRSSDEFLKFRIAGQGIQFGHLL